ncbi:MAG TPA: hypothetical protein VK706_07960 [Candidatus Sulfotelmatobacter sp.]|jgi:hypothetical protein|nr:hypothetical protein [Candidatus Sulfotelmatobacter sp.]
MKKLLGLFAFVLLLTPILAAQESYTEGPLWRLSTVRVKPGHLDEYLANLRQTSKPLLEEEKRQGIILDYKFFLKEDKSDPQDWDVALAIEYKNYASLDGFEAKLEAAQDKIQGNQQAVHQISEKRGEMREQISRQLLEEIILK